MGETPTIPPNRGPPCSKTQQKVTLLPTQCVHSDRCTTPSRLLPPRSAPESLRGGVERLQPIRGRPRDAEAVLLGRVTERARELASAALRLILL
jgi:hypothetical protein